MTFPHGMVLVAAVASLLGCQAPPRPASQPSPTRIASSATPCDDRAASFSADADPIFVGDFLYTCRLEQAYRDLVAPRRACSNATECVFLSGSNVLPGVFINRSHVKYVSAVRDKTSEAEGLVVVSSRCGRIGPPPQSDCIDGLCQAKPVGGSAAQLTP